MMKRLIFILFVFISLSVLSAQTYKEWVDRSYLATDAKDWASAVDCLTNALRTEPGNPQNAWLLSNMATIQRKMGKPQEALQSYTNGLLFAPKSVTLLLNRAALLLEMDSLQTALLDYNSIIIIDSQNREAIDSRGEICVMLNDTVGARRDFDAVLKIDKHDFRACAGLALVNKIVGRYSESEKMYTNLLDQVPDNKSLLFHRAELYFFAQKYPKALVDINKLISLSDSESVNYFLRGKIHYFLYERKLAYDDFVKAKSLGYRSAELEKWMRKIK